MPRIKEHGALVDIISDGSVIIAPRSGKGTTHQGPFNAALDAGANDTYVIALTFRLLSYMVGQSLWFKANTANTGAATLNVNGLGAKTIKKVAGGITTDLATNDIRAGQWVHVVYDGTNFQMLSTSGNAPDVAASILAASISDGDITHAPDGNSVFDALALKANASAVSNVDNTSDVNKPVSTAQAAADVVVADAAAAALLVESNQRIGNDAQYVRTTDGVQTLLGGNAVARAIIGLVEIDTTFAAGDGAAPIFDIGETGNATKFFTGLTTGTAGDKLPFAGFLSANTALIITATAATGATSTGAIHVTALALPEA